MTILTLSNLVGALLSTIVTPRTLVCGINWCLGLSYPLKWRTCLLLSLVKFS